MKQKVIAIIQGRMSSSRLPGKILADIAGQPMLSRVMIRASRATTLDQIIFATTTDASDDPVAEYCDLAGLDYTRGSQFDVLDRYYQTALKAKADIIVRITADCPVIDSELIDNVVNTLLEDEYDFVCNRLPPPFGRTYPIGLDVEACTFKALKKAWKEAKEPQHREHVMPYFYEGVQLTVVSRQLSVGESSRGFKVALLNHVTDFGDYRWTVDTPEDLEFMREVYKHFNGRDDFSWKEVLDLVHDEPDLMKINANVQHKTLKDIDTRATEKVKPITIPYSLMSFITFFSAPKPFTNPHIAMIQRNAIKSWTLLEDVEIILLGNETGIAEIAKEFNIKHFANVKVNESGTPLISSMFEIARENSNSELLCIINADMILMDDFVISTKQAMNLKEQFVLLSQRWDYDITSPIDFAEGWMSQLRESVRKQNQLHRPAGSDFFLFPKSCYQDIPSFTIGRAGWDNWMIYKARKENWAVIDCTPSVMIVHQNHDYSHLPNAKPHYDHPDTNVNIQLAGGQANIRYTILDSTHQLINDKLSRPKMNSLRFTRTLELILRRIFFFLPETMIESIARPKRWKKRLKKIIR